MNELPARREPGLVVRPEIENPIGETGAIGDAAASLSTWERIRRNPTVRRAVVLTIFAILWELAARLSDNPLMFPSLAETFEAFGVGIWNGSLLGRIATSLEVLIKGYSLAIILATCLTVFAISS